MAFEMVHREEWLVVREGQRLGGHDAHHHAADQPRAASGGNAVEIAEFQFGLGQRVGQQAVDALEVRPRGNLRHHAAEAAMLGDLAVDHVCQNASDRPPAGPFFFIGGLDDGNRGLVAARFNAQHAHTRLLASAPRLR